VLVRLVTSIAFDLLGSTVFMLFAVPSLYIVVDDFGLATVARTGQDTEERTAVQAPTE
jgi:HAE1 family hydrophobic/amphiphilic exporter-1